jgi:hypothetical protein
LNPFKNVLTSPRLEIVVVFDGSFILTISFCYSTISEFILFTTVSKVDPALSYIALKVVIGVKNKSPYFIYLIVDFSQSYLVGKDDSVVNSDIATTSPLLYKPKA